MNSKPIVLATDGSPTAGEATKEAFQLAQALDAPLIVVTAWNITFTPYGKIPPGMVWARDGVEKEAQSVLDKTRAAAEEAGLEVQTILKRGIPAEEICAVARERDARLIVIGSHGWGSFKRFFFGSVSTAVLHEAPCGVLIVRPPEGPLREAEEAERRGEHVFA